LRRGLAYLPEYLAAQPESAEYGSIMRTQTISGDRFDRLWQFLEGP
jgi:hypothetical protein